jgi:hypothetical protein
MPEKIVNLGGTIANFPNVKTVPDIPSGDPLAGKMSVNDMVTGMMGGIKTKGASDIPAGSIYSGTRYTETRPGTDYEEMAGQQQSSWEKWRNASAKMVGTAATSFVAGTAGLVYGAGSAIANQKLSKLIDNDVTRTMDQFSTAFEDIAPNYYTHAEQDAEWYSPKNILTANFWSDKVLKNLGFSLGAIAGGVAWGSLLKGIGATNALVRAGKGLEAATAIETAMSAAPKLGKYAAFENALSATAQKYIKNPISSVLKDSDRILTSTMGTFGEASIEGLQGMNQFRNKMIQEYRDIYGVDPKGADLEEINMYADKVGINIWGQNTLLLTGTNYIQLPKILGSSRKVDKALINDVTQAGIGAEFKSVIPTTKFGRLVQGTKGLGSLLFAPSEAFEEGMQSSIQSGVQNYFDRAYKNREDGKSFFKGIHDTMEATLGEGVAETLTSKEGLESILIGGLSGGIQQAGVFGSYKDEKGNTSYGFGKSGTIGEQGVFGMGGERKVNTDMALAALNKTNIKKALQDGSKFANIGIGSQQLRQQAIATDDKLSEKDYEQDFTLSYVMPRVKYGKVDSVNQELDYYQNQAMNEQGFDQLKRGGIANENETQEQFLARINSLKTIANDVNSLYSTLNDKYSNISDKEGNKLYSDDVIDKMVYAASKIKNYDERIPGVNSSLLKAGINTQDIIDSVVKTGENYIDPVKKAISDIDAMDVVDDEKSDLKSDLSDLMELSLRRKEFINQYNDIKKDPSKYKDVDVAEPETPETPEDKEGIIKVKTKDGETEFKINSEYIGGAKEVVTEEGITIQKFSKFKVLGKNDNGAIIIQTRDGKKHTISADEFEKYKFAEVGKMSPSVEFYVENSDKRFFFKKKGGKEIEGRVTYDKKTKSLYFESVETKKNGKPLYRIPVTRDQFVAKKGFKRAQIWSDSKFSERTDALLKQEESAEETDSRTAVEKRLDERRRIIKELADETKAQITNIDEKIVSKKEELAKLNEELGALSEFRVKDKYSNTSIVTNFNKVLSKSMQGLTKLSGLKNSLEREIEELEAQKSGLEFNVEAFDNFIDDVNSLPEDFREMLQELKDQRDGLSDLILNTGLQINQFSKMIDTINDTIKDLVSLLQSAFQKFNNDYPDYIKKNFNEMKDNPLYEKVKELKEYVADYALLEDTKKEISVNEGQIKDVSDKIQDLYNQLDEAGKQLDAKKQIISRFETVLKKYEQKKAEEDLMKKSEDVMKQILGTMNQNVQNAEYDKEYQSDDKKASDVVGKATTYPSAKSFKESGETPSEHHQRANRFGSRLNSFENKEDIKGVVVTNSLQGSIVPGLTEFLAQGKVGIDPTQTIALVMATVNNDGTYTLVDEFGKPIPGKAEDESAEDYAKRLQKSAVFQTFPTVGKLDGMFREGTSQNMIDGIKEEYAIWRATALGAKQLTNYNITASFGRPQNVQENKENGEGTKDNYNARVAVEDSGLVTEDELVTRRVIKVPTTEERVSKGSTSFGNAIGRVFLILKNALQPLNNRQHTAKEANSIFEAMVGLAEIIYQENKKGKFKFEDSPKAQRLVDWLRSTVYWGTPKEGKTGYNNVYFEKTEDGLKLFMSGKQNEEGKQIPVCDFTASSLMDNKGVILDVLQKMYNNTNNKATDDTYYNDRYEQILAVSPEGEVTESVIWPNYQSYLLSSKSPDAVGKLTVKRKADDIPLTTRVRPLANAEDTNRDDIYFIIDNTDIDKRFTDVTAKDAQAVTVTPQKKATAPETKTVTTVQRKYTTDGVTENTIKMKAGEVVFTIDESDPEGTIKIKSVAPEIYTAAFKSAEESGKETTNEIINQTIAGYIIRQVQQDIATPPTVTEQVVVTPAAPAVEEEVLGKFDLDGITKNTVTIGGSEVIFTLDKNDPEGTVKLVSVNEALIQKLLAKQPDRNIVLQTIASKVVQEAKKDIAEVEQSKQVAFEKATQTPTAPVSTDAKADNIISNGDRIINVQTKSVTDEITDTNGELFITSDKDPGGRIYINMDPLKDVLVVPNNTLIVIDKKTGKEIINKELNPEGAVVFEAMQGRLFVVANINGQLIPFYKSSAGTSGKTQGEWYPFFGYTGAWLVKGGIDKATGKMNYSPEIDKVTTLLNENLVFPDKYIDRTTNTIKGNDGVVIMDMNKAFKVNRLWQKEFGSQTGKGTNYEIKGLKENTRSESGLVALITGLNTTELDSAKTPKENSEWFNLISKNAELAALEGKSVTPTITPAPSATPIPTTVQDKLDNAWNNATGAPVDPNLRQILAEQVGKFEGENWKKLESYIKKRLPNVPVYRVKNVLKGTNGVQAYGMFKDGAIYIYTNAEVGTGYHEIFHAVYQIFADANERGNVQKEFRARPGSFTDRVTGEDIKYSEATDREMEEQLAEEFRDYVLYGKVPMKPKDNRPFIVKLFSDLKNFIKELFVGPNAKSNTEILFEKIDKGYYKTFIPQENALSYAKAGIIDIDGQFLTSDAVLSEIPGLSGGQVNDIMQEMTCLTFGFITRDTDDLFNVAKINKSEIYGKVQNNLIETIKRLSNRALEANKRGEITEDDAKMKSTNARYLFDNVLINWDELVKTHEQYLKKYDIEFDENDAIGFTDENNTGKGEYGSSHKIDHFRKLNSAVKLALSTLPRLDNKGNPIESSIGGRVLVPTGEAYMAVMNNVHDSTNIDDLIERIRNMAKENNNYEMLYKRLTKVSSTDDIIWENLKKSDVTLLAAFDVAFNKQNPDVKIFNILPTGDIQIGEANLTSAARQIKQTFLDGMKTVFNNPKNPYFKFDTTKKAYVSKVDNNGVSVAANFAIDTIDEKVRFLDSLGISFNASDIKSLEMKNGILFSKFKEAVAGIKKSLVDGDTIANISGKALMIEGRLLTLAGIKARMENPEFSSSYFGVNGERMQTFMGSNPSSNLFKNLAKITKFEQLANNPNYRYLYTDSFSRHSVILDAMFNIKEADNGVRTGTRKDIAEGREYMKPSIANGMNNQDKSKKKESSRLNYKERLVQEINMNLDGYYYNLVAGDASLEYMTYMGNHIKLKDMRTGYGQIHTIFRGYLIDEINLARENRAVAKDRTSYELRFMKAILGQELTSEILADKTSSPEKIYEDRKNKIDKAVEKFIEKNTNTFKDQLLDYGIISPALNEGKMTTENLGFANNNEEISAESLDLQLKTLTANYVIANIEFHKLIYSDPYQYSDELKRIKNFLSPRQAIISGSAEMNTALGRIWNQGFKEGDLGWTNFYQDYFKSTTLEDVVGVMNMKDYDGWEEGDGGGMITAKSYRNFRIRSSNWNDAEEAQYRHDVEYERLDKSGATEEELEEFDKKNPGVRSAYTAIKPIVAGAMLDNKGKPSDKNNPILDKFALYPLSYRIIKKMAINGTKKGESVKDLNALKLYEKMQSEKLDYVVFKSARKVGAKELNSLYNTDGSFNTNPYKGQINVPFSIMSVQSEVPSKEDELVTRGSQVTKLITMDFMVAGVPIDFLGDKELDSKIYEDWNKKSRAEKEKASPIYKEIMKNQELLEEMTEEGYKTLLKKLGLKEENGKFVITEEGKTKAVQTLRDEILKREVNSNILRALDGYSKGDAVLEATPAYQQVRNILYSLVDKNIVSPKIRGGLKVQIPSTLLESIKAKQETINGKTGFTSNVLEFYSKTEDGKKINVCEIMVGRWFKSDMSDQDLLKYLNDTPEGQKILSGLAFRIPTQKQNSIDVFKIKQFLPAEFGDSVVIPSALVKKVGSDFDIDKLSIYLKNVFTNPKGELKMVPFFGFGEQAKDKFRKMFDDGELLTPKQVKDLDRIMEEQRDELYSPIYDEEGNMIENAERKLFRDIFGGMFSYEKISEDFIKSIDKNGVKEALVNKLYRESLENEYVQSSQNLVSNPLNFNQLVKPNSSKDLEDLSKEITNKIGGKTFDYTEVGNMLDRTFMSSLRHAFVTGKYAIGIAAVAQTNHAQNQRSSIFIDLNKLKDASEEDKVWLKDGKIKFKQYNRMKMGNDIVASLSMAKNKAGDYISDIIGMFIDGYVDIAKGPWIMQLGATPNVASTWLFLVKIGVPIKSVAYFMNQPIIRDYLKSIENAGYSYLFIDDFVEATKNKYRTSEEQLDKVSEIPGETSLFGTLGAKELTPTQNAEQQFILDEFLKYAKMSEQLLHVTQGTNWDTATLNDQLLIFKKNEQLKKANSTIFSSMNENKIETGANGILKNSFIGKVRTFLNSARNAVAEILKSDKAEVRDIMENVLRPYIDIPDADFLKVARKAVSDFYDWAVQVDSNRNQTIKELLLSDDNAPKQVLAFKNEIAKDTKHALYNNYVIGNKGILETKPADREGGVNNISIKNKDNKVYDQDQVIFAFREMRDHLKSINKLDLYEKIVGVSVLQSGLSTTPYSFTSLLPYEDFKDVYNNILFKIEARDNIMDFYKLGVFQRANATNDDIVPQQRARVVGGKYNRGMDFGGAIQTAIQEGKIPQLLKLSTLSQGADSEYVTYSWSKNISEAEKNKMIQAADYSFMNKALFQKVYFDDDKTQPVIDRYYSKKKKKNYDSYVYKMVNSWGDGFRANEFYGKIQPSVIDNGFTKVQEGKSTNEFIFGNQVFTEEIKTSGEKPDSAVNQYFSKVLPVVSEENVVSSQTISDSNIDISIKEKLNSFTKQSDALSWYKYELPKLLSNNKIVKEINNNVSKAIDLINKNDTKTLTNLYINQNIPYIQNIIDIFTGELSKKGINNEMIMDKNDPNATTTFLENVKVKELIKFKGIIGQYAQSVTSKQFAEQTNSFISKEDAIKELTKLISTQAPTGDVVSMRNKAAELEQKKKTKGLGPVEMATLSYLEQQLGKIIKSQC